MFFNCESCSLKPHGAAIRLTFQLVVYLQGETASKRFQQQKKSIVKNIEKKLNTFINQVANSIV